MPHTAADKLPPEEPAERPGDKYLEPSKTAVVSTESTLLVCGQQPWSRDARAVGSQVSCCLVTVQDGGIVVIAEMPNGHSQVIR